MPSPRTVEDLLLPTEPALLEVARELYRQVRSQPIISPHGHVDVASLAYNQPLGDPTRLLISNDHYVTRLLHAQGYDLRSLGVGANQDPEGSVEASRQAWKILCSNWSSLAGTPVRYWLEYQLRSVFGVETPPSASSAEDLYEHLDHCLHQPEYLPRALFERFGIEALATTDDPSSDLSEHRMLQEDPTFKHPVVPTFRPDRLLEVGASGWIREVERLRVAADMEVADYSGFLAALAQRRRYFIDHGATSADHSHLDVGSAELTGSEASRIFVAALSGEVTDSEAVAFRRHMLLQMAAMSVEDGLVMTLHPGICRDHHGPTARAFGHDVGADIPLPVEFTVNLRPLLQRFGTAAGFHLVLFTVDETTWSRELAPLAGFYPSVFVGVPWWFLDAPSAIRRFREAVTEIAGYSKTSGFVDDTRAFCSIPARHDMSRRVEAGILAGHVAGGLIPLDEASTLMTELAGTMAQRVFKLKAGPGE